MATACYTPTYLPASYKAVPFDAMDMATEVGRRGAEGEFPFGEETAYVDMGRKIRRYRISGRFASNAHVGQAAAMIAVCETPGPGLLVHPTLGPLMVACKALSVKDNPLTEQGVTYIEFEFVEASLISSGISFGGGIFGIALTGITQVLRAAFVSAYVPSQIRYFDGGSIQNTMRNGIESVHRGYILGSSTDVFGSGSFADDINRRRYQTSFDFSVIVGDPISMATASTVFDTVSNGMSLIDTVQSGDDKFENFTLIANMNAKASMLHGEAGLIENQFYSTIRVLSAGHMARAALETEPDTVQDALRQADMVDVILTQEMEYFRDVADNSELYVNISRFKTEVLTKLYKRAYDAPALVTFDTGMPMHSLVAAYELMDDAKRHRELMTHNREKRVYAMASPINAHSVD